MDKIRFGWETVKKHPSKNPTGHGDRVRKSYMTTSSKYRSGNRYKGRVSIPGAYYHIIVCTHQRQKILANNTAASIIFSTFDWLEAENRIEWICIMVMPDHLHTVIRLGEGQTLAKVLHSLKLFTARKINKHLSRNGAFWQKSYTDWGIRTETVLNKTCYTNPMRKGIVASARDYPYWRCKFEME